jgi:hypothetical protein
VLLWLVTNQKGRGENVDKGQSVGVAASSCSTVANNGNQFLTVCRGEAKNDLSCGTRLVPRVSRC